MLTRAPELPTIARYPLDVTKTRLAASKAGQYTGILDCMTSTVRGEGFLALFKGVRPALAAIIPASGVDLAVYNTLREAYCEKAEARYQTELEQRTMEILQAGEADSGLELPPSPLGHPPISFTLGFGAVRLALFLHYLFICSARCLLLVYCCSHALVVNRFHHPDHHILHSLTTSLLNRLRQLVGQLSLTRSR